MPGVGIISPSKVLELPPRPDTATGTSGVYSSPARGPQCAPPGPDAGVLYRGDCRLPGGSRSGRVRGSSPVFLPLFTPRSEVVRRRFAARARGFVKGWTGWLTRGTLVLRGLDGRVPTAACREPRKGLQSMSSAATVYRQRTAPHAGDRSACSTGPGTPLLSDQPARGEP